jgi:hypothetical protein
MLAGNLASIGVGGIIATAASYIVSPWNTDLGLPSSLIRLTVAGGLRL